MKSTLRTILSRVVIAIAFAAVIGIAWLTLETTAYESDRREAEWRSLTRTIHSLRGKTLPDAWTMGVFVSGQAINNLLSGIRNASVFFDPAAKPDEDTVLTIREVKVDLKPGLPTGEINFFAESKKRNIRIELGGKAALVFRGIQIESGEKPIAKFGIQLLRLEPILRWQFFSVSARGYATELLATGTAVALSKALNFTLPLPDKPVIDLSLNRTDRVPVRDPKNENWVDLVTTGGAGKLQEGLSFNHPIFISDGMWLGAERRDGGQEELEVVDRGNRTDAQLDTEIAELRDQLKLFKGPSVGAADFAIWLNGKALGNLLGTIAALPANRRMATVQSIGYQGYLAKKDWNDKILGNGGAFVEFNKPDAVNGEALIDSVSAKWQSGKGLTFASHIKLTGKADVHLQVDPLIGGGVGANVGMLGAAEADLNGEMAIKALTVGTHSVLAIFPKIECRALSMDLTTNGELAGDWGWTKVPKIGGRFSAPTDASLLPPQIIMSDAPYVARGRSTDDSALQVKVAGNLYRVMPAWKTATVSVMPLQAVTNEDGLLVGATLNVSLSPEWSDTSRVRDDAEAKLKSDFAAAYKPTECPGDTTIAVLLGDLEFGPNNEIVKFLRNAWNDITKGPGKNNEVVKVLRAATDAITASGQPIDDVTKHALNDLDGMAKNTFGNNSEAAKAVNTIVRTLAPPTVGKNADGGVTVTVPGGGTVSTGGDRGAGVTVETPLGKWKF